MKKTINFRQIEWFGEQMDLPALLQTMLALRPNVDQTSYQRDGETFEVRHRGGDQTEIRLHLAAYVQGALKPVSPHVHGIAAADLSEAAPPANTDFAEREIALVIRQDKLGYVASGMTPPRKVESALRGILALGYGPDVANRLVLSARADADMITALVQQGVDRLDLGLVLPSAEADQIVGEQPASIAETLGRMVGNEIRTRVTHDLDGPEIDALEEMSARLRLKLRKRKPTLEQVQSLTAIAADAVEGDEEFRIRTVDGIEFTRDKLLLKSSFNHPNNSATLQYLLAWNATADFLNQH